MPRKRVRRNQRPHGQGSVKELPGGKVRAWRPPADGKRASRLFDGPGARDKAEAWLRGVEPGPTMTLEFWFEIWIARRWASLRESSRRRYGQYFAMVGGLASRPLGAVTVDDWQRHVNALLFGDQAGRTVYARASVDRARAIWSAALTAAVRAGHIPTNPLLETLLPTRTEQPPKAWRGDEVRRLISAAEGERHEAFLHLGLSTGLRLGELRALAWADVDLEALAVTVSKSMDNNTHQLGPTKTGRVRIVPLPEETAQILSAHRMRQPLGTDLVIGRPGGAYHPSTLRDWLRKLCKMARATPLPPHSLRHTFAAMALADGVDLPALSATLGHANIVITGTIYAHWISQRARPTAGAISRRLYGSSAPRAAHERGSDQEEAARV